jgi:hypothetical protein
MGQLRIVDEELLPVHSETLKGGRVLGAELVDAPADGELELLVWNKRDVLLWDSATLASTKIGSTFQGQERTARLSGVLDIGDGDLVAWTTRGEILRWEF